MPPQAEEASGETESGDQPLQGPPQKGQFSKRGLTRAPGREAWAARVEPVFAKMLAFPPRLEERAGSLSSRAPRPGPDRRGGLEKDD